MAVAREKQQSGIGKALILEAENHCRQSFVRRLIVCTGSWETGTIAFYQKRGFTIFNVVKDFFTLDKGYDLNIRDQVQLEKFL